MPKELTQPTRLRTIAKDMRLEIDAALKSHRASVIHAARAGQLLTEAKGLVAHGEWLPWVEKNCPLSARQVQGYMRLGEHLDELEEAANTRGTAYLESLSIDGALKLLSKPRPEPQPSPDPVTCPNCGSHSVDEDGDCSSCREPAANMQTVTEDGEPVEDRLDNSPGAILGRGELGDAAANERLPPDGLCTRVLAVCEAWQDDHPETTGHAVAVILRSVADQIEDV